MAFADRLRSALVARKDNCNPYRYQMARADFWQTLFYLQAGCWIAFAVGAAL